MEKNKTISDLSWKELEIPIIGETPLICHALGLKKILGMIAPSITGVKLKKLLRRPAEEAVGAAYVLPDGNLGLRAVAFKNAMKSAAIRFTLVESIESAVAVANARIYVASKADSDLVPIFGKLDKIRLDTVRNTNRAARTVDVRFRPQIFPWGALLRIDYVSSLTTESVVGSLVNAAGAIGVGDWRPERNGIYGRFRVATTKEWQEFRNKYGKMHLDELKQMAQEFEANLRIAIENLQRESSVGFNVEELLKVATKTEAGAKGELQDDNNDVGEGSQSHTSCSEVAGASAGKQEDHHTGGD